MDLPIWKSVKIDSEKQLNFTFTSSYEEIFADAKNGVKIKV